MFIEYKKDYTKNLLITEVLRLWPPAPVADRRAARDYNLGRPNSAAQQDYIVCLQF